MYQELDFFVFYQCRFRIYALFAFLTANSRNGYYECRVKKVAAFISSVVALAALAPVSAYAAVICPTGQFSNLCNLQPSKAGNIVGVVIQVLLIIAIILSLFYLIWGGVRYIMSGGDKGKIDQARSTLTAAIIGLVISLLAFFIVGLILQVFTGQGLTTLQIPKLL